MNKCSIECILSICPCISSSIDSLEIEPLSLFARVENQSVNLDPLPDWSVIAILRMSSYFDTVERAAGFRSTHQDPRYLFEKTNRTDQIRSNNQYLFEIVRRFTNRILSDAPSLIEINCSICALPPSTYSVLLLGYKALISPSSTVIRTRAIFWFFFSTSTSYIWIEWLE